MIAELTPIIIIIYALAGLFAGLIGGMLGLGGGIIIVPVLHYLFLQQEFPATTIMQMAVTTSLATIIVTSISATYIHHKKEAVVWTYVYKLALGILLGACLGAVLADTVSSNALRIIFGIFEITVAIQIGLELKPAAKLKPPATAGMIFSGSGIGFLSTLLGIGGGTLTVPFLLLCNVNIRNAVAISAACGFPIAIAGTSALIITGLDNPDLPAHSIGYLYWPAALIIITMTVFSAPLGAKLAHFLPVKILKRIFSVVLIFVGLKMLM